MKGFFVDLLAIAAILFVVGAVAFLPLIVYWLGGSLTDAVLVSFWEYGGLTFLGAVIGILRAGNEQ